MMQRTPRMDWTTMTATNSTDPGQGATWCLIVAVGLLAITGCRTFAAPQDLVSSPPAGVSPSSATDNPVVQVSGESTTETVTESAKKTGTQLFNFVSGREQENVSRARELYQEGDALFRQASSQPRDQAVDTYREAAKLFQRTGEAAPETALEQDALFMQGESLFFADRFTEATDVYEKLQKRFPRNRHIDRVAGRLFSISRYWIQTAEAKEGSWFPINLTDPKLPRLDVDGHAIRVLDQIRYDDPTGRLADDATMAAAAEFIRQQDFERADEFLTDLRETFSDSEHLFLAHMLGIRCKLETYAGPAYSGLVLEEAEDLVKKTRQRFPDKMQEKQYGDIVARAAAEIAFKRAERLVYRASYREKRKEFGSARFYYQQLVEQFPETPQADTARERLEQIAELPAVPKQRLSWLTTIFADRDRASPLQPTHSNDSSQTMLR
jgi:TolA-binding protein